jgi:two-component system chemotaxis response regulator CheY
MPKKRIMVVDDSASLRELVSATLGSAGYEVIEAANGEQALKMLNGEKIDLIVCDVLMPLMDGITFVKHAKAMPDYRFVPIIMLTTESSEKTKLKGQAAGAKAWLVKPFRPERLLHAVLKLILP